MRISTRLVTWLAAALALAAADLARAADKPVFAPPEAWVEIAPIPAVKSQPSGPALETLLDDSQTRYGVDGDEFYNRRVVRIARTEGLAGQVMRDVSWDPETQSVAVHALKLIRGGKTIDILRDGAKMEVFRRETNLEKAMIDGRLTASIQIPGLQVGDVIDWSFTLTARDPVMAGRSQGFSRISIDGVVGRLRIRNLWPDAKPMQWRAGPAFRPVVTHKDGWSELLIDQAAFTTPRYPVGAPARYWWPAEVQISQFKDWGEVSALMAPLYAKSETVAPNSPLKAEIARIKASTADPKARAAAGLQLVEDQTRYLYLGLNSGGYTPAPVDETWTRRFGDCKAKTVMLLALLKGLGVEAQPVLVSTTDGDALGDALPSLRFDHVLVRAVIGGKAYWLDGTRTGDKAGLESLAPPPYLHGLTVAAAGGKLVDIPQPFPGRPQSATVIALDASAGLDQPVKVAVTTDYWGDNAVAMERVVASQSESDAKRVLRQQVARGTTWLDVADVAWVSAPNHFTLKVTGSADMPWLENPDIGLRELKLPSTRGTSLFPVREAGVAYPDAPYAAAYPTLSTVDTYVALPNGGQGYSVRGWNATEDVGPYHFEGHAAMKDGVAHFEASTAVIKREFPAADLGRVNHELRRLGQMDFYVRAPKPALLQASAARGETSPSR